MIDLQLERRRERKRERRKKGRVIARGRMEGTELPFLRRPNYLDVVVLRTPLTLSLRSNEWMEECAILNTPCWSPEPSQPLLEAT